MKIDHIAIWAENLELLREFYIHYFDMSSSGKYINAKKISVLISCRSRMEERESSL